MAEIGITKKDGQIDGKDATIIEIEGSQKDVAIYKNLEGKQVRKLVLKVSRPICESLKINKDQAKEILIKDLHKLAQQKYYEIFDETIEFDENEVFYRLRAFAEPKLK